MEIFHLPEVRECLARLVGLLGRQVRVILHMELVQVREDAVALPQCVDAPSQLRGLEGRSQEKYVIVGNPSLSRLNLVKM